MALEPLFHEFRSILEQEVDYEVEAKYQKDYSAQVNGLKAHDAFQFFVPEVIEEISTARVLAMTYEPGLALRSWIAKKPEMAKRESLARAILDLYFHEFFEWGLVQTDPNWANFLVRDESPQLGSPAPSFLFSLTPTLDLLGRS